MKKYFSTPEYKKRNKRVAKRSAAAKTRWKLSKKKRNQGLQGLNHAQRYYKVNVEDRYKDYKKLIAPSEFSFINNPDDMSYFIGDLQDALETKKKAFVVLRHVKSIDHDALVVLLSIMIKFKSMKIDFNGNIPADPQAAAVLRRSGFLDNLYRSFNEENTYELIKQSYIHTHASKMVDAELGKSIMESISQRVWGEKRIYKGFQRTLIELMQNTNNHASDNVEGEKHWWLSVNLVPKQKMATFAFIDYGVGIFASLDNKGANSKFYNWYKILERLFAFSDNAEVMKLILDGHLHKTVSKKYYRGKGLPGIKEAMDRNQISRLVIITNNVYANVGEDKYKILKEGFSGTYVYWELKDDNIHFPWPTSISA